MWLLASIVALTVPGRDVLVSDTRGDIEHDDTALAIDVVSISEAAEFLLPSSIPDVELDGSQVLLMVLDLSTHNIVRPTPSGKRVPL